MTEPANIEPNQAAAGDTWTWRRGLSNYPAPAWTLTYHFVNRVAAFSLVAGADGADHLVQAAPATTAAYQDGRYSWRAFVSDGTDRHQVAAGEMEVLPDFAKQGAGFDTRDHAQKVLESIEAVIEGRAGKDQESYQIEGRRLDRTPIADLLRLRLFYRQEARQNQDAERIRKGLGSNRTIRVRM